MLFRSVLSSSNGIKSLMKVQTKLTCRICNNEITSVHNHKLCTLCENCEKTHNKYLIKLESQFPCLTKGVFEKNEVNTLTFEQISIDSASKLHCYQKINIPGKDTYILGKGAYGEVWLVEHRSLKKKYALKVIHRQNLGNTYQTKNLRCEVGLQQRINHNNIIKIYDIIADKENIYILIDRKSVV